MARSGIIFTVLAGLLLSGSPASAQYYLDAEGGAVRAEYNTARIPLDGGTRFSLSDELRADTAPYFRIRAGRKFGRNDLSFLAAPLTLRYEGVFSRDVAFNGEVFAAGIRTDAVYRFNSYRIRYLREFHRTDTLSLRWGGSLKLRHAGIALSNSSKAGESKNTGFVPLAAFSARYGFSRGYSLDLDIEALGAPQGRAEDCLFAVSRELRPGMRLRLGYRLLEGGAGAGDVYTFAWLHYLSAGFTWEL